MVSSARAWLSAVCWLSATWNVSRHDREAVGQDGELYAWARLGVCEVRNGRFAMMCLFEIDDEEAAFAYAEDLVATRPSRLAVANRATEAEHR